MVLNEPRSRVVPVLLASQPLFLAVTAGILQQAFPVLLVVCLSVLSQICKLFFALLRVPFELIFFVLSSVSQDFLTLPLAVAPGWTITSRAPLL
jgi:hypothetical protein